MDRQSIKRANKGKPPKILDGLNQHKPGDEKHKAGKSWQGPEKRKARRDYRSRPGEHSRPAGDRSPQPGKSKGRSGNTYNPPADPGKALAD